MKISVILSAAVSAADVGCYWATGNTGAFLECLPEHYIQGACESGQRAECRINFKATVSAGIKCCPTTPEMNFGSRRECAWFGANSGSTVTCPAANAAFGRCSTTGRSNGHGDCNKLSHMVQCCKSASHVEESTCAWIYNTHGGITDCPAGKLVSGFCGVNNSGDCPNKQYIGLKCCAPQ